MEDYMEVFTEMFRLGTSFLRSFLIVVSSVGGTFFRSEQYEKRPAPRPQNVSVSYVSRMAVR